MRQAPADALAPFWVATRFSADHREVLKHVASWGDLTARLDGLRDNANLFVAIRLRGVFERIRYRVACKAEAGVDLVSATSAQATFELENVAGTLVGFWTPSFARTINVPGYHLHLLSDDHRHAGHVLELQSHELSLELHRENHLQLVLPETPAFLNADLSGDPAAALAEGDHREPGMAFVVLCSLTVLMASTMGSGDLSTVLPSVRTGAWAMNRSLGAMTCAQAPVSHGPDNRAS